MSSDLKAWRTLLLRLETAVTRMEDVAEGHVSKTDSCGPDGVIVGSASSSSKEVSDIPDNQAGDTRALLGHSTPATIAFDALCATELQQFLDLSHTIGSPVLDQAQLIGKSFEAQKELIVTASQCKQPSYVSPQFATALQPLQEMLVSISAIRDNNRPSHLFNHLSAVADGSPAIGWVAVEKTPAPYIGEMKESAEFYANRVIKEYKSKDGKHVDWIRSFTALLLTLQRYVKEHHTTGLTWNARGTDLQEYQHQNQKDIASRPDSGAPPPPPPGPPPPPLQEEIPASAVIAPAVDMNSVFADLNRGSSVTSGLKKVDKTEMTHKNPGLRASSVVPDVKKSGNNGQGQTAIQTSKKPTRKELQGTKWIIENYEGASDLVIDDIELNHTVYVFNCTNSTIQIKGKFNAITVDGCKKTGIVLDTLVSSVELLKSNSFALQIMDKCPTIICDSCDSGQIYLSQSGLECEILTSKCSSVNINVPNTEGDFKEQPVPEMLKHCIVNGTLVTTLVEYHD